MIIHRQIRFDKKINDILVNANSNVAKFHFRRHASFKMFVHFFFRLFILCFSFGWILLFFRYLCFRLQIKNRIISFYFFHVSYIHRTLFFPSHCFECESLPSIFSDWELRILLLSFISIFDSSSQFYVYCHFFRRR